MGKFPEKRFPPQFYPILEGELRIKNKICWVKLSDDPFGWPLLLKNPPNNRGSLYYQPKQCIIIREIPEIYHRFLLFGYPQMGAI